MKFVLMFLFSCRVPTPPGKSWKVLEFSLENFQDLEVLENDLGPGKSCKSTCKFLESPGIC